MPFETPTELKAKTWIFVGHSKEPFLLATHPSSVIASLIAGASNHGGDQWLDNRRCRGLRNSALLRKRRKWTDKCRRDRHRLMWQLPQIYLVLARVVIPNYVTGIELFVDGGMAQV